MNVNEPITINVTVMKWNDESLERALVRTEKLMRDLGYEDVAITVEHGSRRISVLPGGRLQTTLREPPDRTQAEFLCSLERAKAPENQTI